MCPICRDRDCPGCDWGDDEVEVDDEPVEIHPDYDADRAADAWERWRDERYA